MMYYIMILDGLTVIDELDCDSAIFSLVIQNINFRAILGAHTRNSCKVTGIVQLQ